MTADPTDRATPRIPATDIRAFIARALVRVGLPDGDAGIVADLMTEADVTGADAHGVFRLPQYVQRIRDGGLNIAPRITVDRTAVGTAVVDGDNGMGHLVMARAAQAAIEMARESGVAWVGARGSNHAGPAALYAAMPARQGMVGIYSAVASANHMAIWGGSEPLLGTNPLAIGIPRGTGAPLLLDMATTVVSYGTIKNHALQGKTLPEGWLVDRQSGESLTDASRSAEGLLLPIGGYKGSGLALMLGLLAGTLNGAAMGRDVVDFNADSRTPTNTGHFIVALDIARFLSPEVFTAEVERHLVDLKASPRLPAFDSIRLPGEQRESRRHDRERQGVPLSPALRARLDALAADLGIESLGT